MTNELEKYQAKNIETIDNLDTGTFLPYLTIAHGMSPACTDNAIPPGNWCLNREDDLGKELDLFIALTRMTAVDPQPGAMVRSYDPNSSEFKAIVEQASQKNSQVKWGREALVYIFIKQTWATYLLGNKTTRKYGTKLYAQNKMEAEQTQKTGKWVGGFLNQPVTVRVKTETKQWKDSNGQNIKATWYLPIFNHLPAQTCRERYSEPDLTSAKDIYEQFMNPPVAETVEPEENERPR